MSKGKLKQVKRVLMGIMALRDECAAKLGVPSYSVKMLTSSAAKWRRDHNEPIVLYRGRKFGVTTDDL